MAKNIHIDKIPQTHIQVKLINFRTLITKRSVAIHNKLIKHHQTVTPEKWIETRVTTILKNKMTTQFFPFYQFKAYLIKLVGTDQ